jgi:very-short-patch-repair endonuclease
MKQPNKKNKIVKQTVAAKKTKKKPLFGTSKLEEDFARDFLDKLGVKYIWQFEAKDIKRWFDFYLPEHNLLIEIDGGYW